MYPKLREHDVHAFIKDRKTRYNCQPPWSLCELASKSLITTKAILQEFSEAAHEASEAFIWTTKYPSHDPTSNKPWNIGVHGWKHVSFRDFDAKSRDVHARKGKSLSRQTVFNLEIPELERLVLRASEREPEEVARLWQLCKSHANVRRLISLLWMPNADELVAKIPSPTGLGNSYIESIIAKPDKKSNSERERLIALTATGSILGIDTTGAPRTPYTWPDVVFIREMAFSLMKQIRQARALLENTPHLPDESIAETALEYLGIDDQFLADQVKKEKAPQDNILANELAAQRLVDCNR